MFTQDGSLLADALHATNSGAGGGSGGSIWLKVDDMRGHGLQSVNGGDGNGVGGGGAGGHIALHTITENEYRGATSALGGSGADFGGPGTVFVEEQITADLDWSTR